MQIEKLKQSVSTLKGQLYAAGLTPNTKRESRKEEADELFEHLVSSPQKIQKRYKSERGIKPGLLQKFNFGSSDDESGELQKVKEERDKLLEIVKKMTDEMTDLTEQK